MLNNWTGAGRLTRDPDLRQTQSGKSVANFSIAIDRDFARQDGERDTDFIDVVVWDKTAEFVSKYFQKGSMIIVNGRLQVRTWQDDDGNNRRVYEIVANNVYFGGSKNDGNSTSYSDASKTKASNKPIYTPSEDEDEDPDSLPF